MMRRLVDMVIRLLLALALAVLVWVIAVQESDPVAVVTFPAAIPIDLLNQPPDTIVYGASAATARVVLRAPSSVRDSLSAGQIDVTLDLTGQPYGQINVPLQARVDNKIIQVVRVEPAYVDLYLEPARSRQVSVSLAIVGEPALGYTIRSSSTTPAEISVSGPASRVDQVDTVGGSLSVQDERQNVERSIKLTARDKNNAIVDGISLSPETVQARAMVEQLGGFRDLAVRVVITGQVASGYRINTIKVAPPIVAVFGSSQAIDSLPGYVETASVNVENAQGRVTERVPLNLPGGISLLGDPSVQVDISIEAIQSGLTLQLRPIVQGLAAQLEARVSPEYIDLVLTGPLPRLQTLQPDENVRVVVDVASLAPGTYQVTPHIIVPDEVVAESVLPATIQVTIGIAGSISPLSTPTARPEPTPVAK